MLIDSFIPMQNGLRNLSQISEMVEFVGQGGIFTQDALADFATKAGAAKPSPLIKLARFEDGQLYIHDGHHRATAIWIGGRKELDLQEFFIEDWKYSDYMTINLDQKWYTVFDPRKEVRIYDILKYKKLVEDFINGDQKPDFESIRKFIFDHYEARSYTESRSVNRIAEMVKLHALAN